MKTMYLFAFLTLVSAAQSYGRANTSSSDASGISILETFVQPPQRRTPEEMAQRETNWMKTELQLTDDQVPRVDSINLKYAKKMHEIWTQNQGDRATMRSKRAELDTQKRTELATILTDDQLKKYDDAIAARRQRMRGQWGN